VTDIVRTAHPDSWSPDGRVLAFHRHTESNQTHLFTVAVDDPGAEPVGLLEREFSAESTTFSPDGRYVAYMSTQSGDSEVYIRPFPGPGPQVTVSVGGGRQPVWARNGELFTGTFFNTLGSPRPQFDVTADGQRFLMLRPEGAAQASIIVVQNWFDELRRLVPLQK
jgi:dipeptidyl aminopeptidase/acylaminoacyl peptidase